MEYYYMSTIGSMILVLLYTSYKILFFYYVNNEDYKKYFSYSKYRDSFFINLMKKYYLYGKKYNINFLKGGLDFYNSVITLTKNTEDMQRLFYIYNLYNIEKVYKMLGTKEGYEKYLDHYVKLLGSDDEDEIESSYNLIWVINPMNKSYIFDFDFSFNGEVTDNISLFIHPDYIDERYVDVVYTFITKLTPNVMKDLSVLDTDDVQSNPRLLFTKAIMKYNECLDSDSKYDNWDDARKLLEITYNRSMIDHFSPELKKELNKSKDYKKLLFKLR